MVSKTGHASNEKVKQQTAQANLPEVDKDWIDGELKKAEALIENRTQLNQNIGNILAGISDRTGHTKEVLRTVIKDRKRTKESYAQYIHLLNDLKRKLGMQPEYNAMELDKPAVSKKIVEDIRVANVNPAVMKEAKPDGLQAAAQMAKH